jgi:hypothetical protein
MDTTLNSITVNGETYVRQDHVASTTNTLPSGNRHVVVVDSGWIYAGNVSILEKFGQTFYALSEAIHVFSLREIGFTGVLENPKSSKVTLKQCSGPVMLPLNSVISLHPVEETWGK